MKLLPRCEKASDGAQHLDSCPKGHHPWMRNHYVVGSEPAGAQELRSILRAFMYVALPTLRIAQ